MVRYVLADNPVRDFGGDDVMEWQPIETAPMDGTFVLLHVPKGLESGSVTVGAYWDHQRWGDDRDDKGRYMKGHWDGWLGMDIDVMSSWCDPTHWMNLPGPPK